MAGVLALAVSCGAAAAQGDTTRIIFPFAAGGSGDALARILADQLQKATGKAAIVDNRAGAQGRLGVAAVKTAAPDGRTLLLTPIAPVAIYQHVYKNLSYDPIADLTPVSQVTTFDFAMAVGPQVKVSTVKELVEWAKKNPEQGSYGTPAAGTLPHFFAVSFGKAAGIELRHVGYRGSAVALTDLLAGQIPIMVTTTSDLIEQHKAGRIRVLATSDAKRSQFLPDVPTFREAGYAIEGVGWYGVFAPAGTPKETVAKISRIMADAVKLPEVRERLLGFALNPTGTTPEELAAIQKRDSALWEPAVKASGYSPEQ
ncbi:MAG: Bug family tripartite tricarboxylate transporter substrate binding protein [Hyphomicrobiaceae bacterium]|nr:Bug family tripartite tricarboxylate transporter substrate binding protein [Hyphomicrobiaceae bacterium]